MGANVAIEIVREVPTTFNPSALTNKASAGLSRTLGPNMC